MRRGVPLLGIALLVAASAAAAAHGAGSTGTTTTSTTTTGSTTTGAMTTTPAPTYAPLRSAPLPTTCVGGGVAAISEHGRARAAVAPTSDLGPSDYPQVQPLVAFDSAAVGGSRCRNGTVTLSNVSLLDGVVTASSVQATDGKGTVSGLEVDGASVTVSQGEAIPLGSWGVVLIGTTMGRLSAPLALHFVRAHDSLPAGTEILVGFSAVRQPVAKPAAKPKTAAARPSQTVHRVAKHRHRRKHRPHVPQPLKWTPRLGIAAARYVFPVDGGASWGDTYGANRNDIYDGWHHGDDLFAPLGTPVVAVATGKLSLVGWNSLGGWRIWLTDAKGNSFYYAHLSGYSRWSLRHRNVRAGEVIGFLGRTGDAFTTTPHLHFEIHPHQLLRLGYDGAVDPSSYLKTWRMEKVPASQIPAPARLRAPKGTPAQEAAVVWNQLLAARHLLPNGEPQVAFAGAVRRPFPSAREPSLSRPDRRRRVAAIRVASEAAPEPPAGPLPMILLGLTLVASVLGALVSAHRRRRRAPLH
jgi:murein DD-endopeptidase MepM/ murein hydrolase activator NlpD